MYIHAYTHKYTFTRTHPTAIHTGKCGGKVVYRLCT